MELYDLVNIQHNNIEKAIKEAISDTKKTLKNLTTNQMCLIYTSYVYYELRKKHVVAHIMDTEKDFKMEYRHLFVAIPKGVTQNYIIDLTYNQFQLNSLFNDMYINGYQLLDNEKYQKYLDNITESTKHKTI